MRLTVDPRLLASYMVKMDNIHFRCYDTAGLGFGVYMVHGCVGHNYLHFLAHHLLQNAKEPTPFLILS